MTARQVLDQSGNPTGVLEESYPGSRAAMTGIAVTVSGFANGQVVLIKNNTDYDIFARSDGTAAVSTGASMIVFPGEKEAVVVQHGGGTISLIGTNDATKYVWLTPIKTS